MKAVVFGKTLNQAYATRSRAGRLLKVDHPHLTAANTRDSSATPFGIGTLPRPPGRHPVDNRGGRTVGDNA